MTSLILSSHAIASRMKVLITGATGFLGRAIAKELLLRGHELVVVSRNAEKSRSRFPFPARFISWDPVDSTFPAEELEGIHAVVHLAGESIAAKRWSPEQKKMIRDSRVLGTRHLWQGVAQARALGKTRGLRAFVGGSAIGFYGDRADETLTEAAAAGKGYLSDVCRQWESEVFRPGFDEVRQVAIRTGVVLGLESGALAKLLPIFKTGVGGPVCNGKQWMSWIHIDDIARVFAQAVESDSWRGVINGVAPEPVTNAEFSQRLGQVLGRPAAMPAPAMVLKLAMGEMSHIVLDSQRVKPEKLLREGFEFRFRELEPALRDLCAPWGDARVEQFSVDQWVPQPVEEIFRFFSDAKNLETLTPPWLHFEIKKISDPEIRKGTLIDYRLKLHGMPLQWRSRIDEWDPNHAFVDSQLKGPYAKWQHTHVFRPARGGTLISDRVLYRLPLGALGKGVARLRINRDIEQIFAFRRKRISEMFSGKGET